MAGATRMLQRRGTAAEWQSQNPVLGDGEIGFVTDTRDFKIGDGVTTWNNLVSGHMSPGIFNAKGDLLVATGPGQYEAVPVGPQGNLLVPDASQSSGVKWTNILEPSAVDHVGLILKRLAGQTADMLEIQDENGVVLAQLGPDAAASFLAGLYARTNSAHTIAGFFESDNAGRIPVRLKGANGQTANLLELVNNADALLANANAFGDFYTGGSFHGQTFTSTNKTAESTLFHISGQNYGADVGAGASSDLVITSVPVGQWVAGVTYLMMIQGRAVDGSTRGSAMYMFHMENDSGTPSVFTNLILGQAVWANPGNTNNTWEITVPSASAGGTFTIRVTNHRISTLTYHAQVFTFGWN